jgi:hypothetical protein
MQTLGIRARGARGDEKSFAIEGMRRIVNGHDFQRVIECVIDRGMKLSSPLIALTTGC